MLWVCCSPAILVFGICGNLLTLLVMLRSRMSGNSTSVFLPVLAVADSIALVSGIIPEWLEMAHIIKLKGLHPWSCRAEKVIFYSSIDASIWTLLAFTIDRWLAVVFPLKKTSWCTERRAKIAVIVVICSSIGLNSHVLWTRGTVRGLDRLKNETWINHCGKPEPYAYFEKFIRPWIVFGLANALPVVLICFCNTMIVNALIRIPRRDGAMGVRDRDKANVLQTTFMCLSASFLFLFCVTPSIIVLIGRPWWDERYWYDVVKAVANLLTHVNHSVNFLLYCVSGRRFREELISMLRGEESPTSLKALRRATIMASMAYNRRETLGTLGTLSTLGRSFSSNNCLDRVSCV